MARTSYEDAVKSQGEAKADVKAKKQALADYFTKNKLKKSKDYSKDEKHGPKVQKLEKEIKKSQATMEGWNEKVTKLKPDGAKGEKKGARAKYDYPADVLTSEQRKKYRTAQRNAAAGKEPRVKKEKKEKTSEAGTKPSKVSGKSSKEEKKSVMKKKKVKGSEKKSADKKSDEKVSKKSLKKGKSKKSKSEDD